ncbi:hypothetical protein [Sporanaerobacter acetigenes]|uniref:DUF5704 domain-containing protein n=1 Tax=Sporanaerobacter acetigenes DSM 13106 TaxID=1123281 RepID=A0A1M5UA13_9FIRM|nr:hypothetical protein [Sporanaerobacter acetigenes]SHH59748.1 hypothetical protein SAMN02745180_00572 [Sporanaerobacter acetigenes DSM 13106]
MKRAVKVLVALLLCIALLPISVLADGGGDDNAGSGDGGTSGKVDGKGFYRSGEWMYKVSLYVGLSDTALTSTSFYCGYKAVGDPVFVKPKSFSLPSGVIFGKYNKVEYLRGKPLVSDNNPKIITDNPPAIPITNGGRLSAVKNYFGDSGTLIRLINNVAKQQGTTREGLVKNTEFTIGGKKGKQNPNDILPLKGSDGKYKNKVPWVIIYEPICIAHLKDGNTKLAFTATEYAMAQEQGLFNFFYSGKDAQYIAGMTHCNLPNSVVLEKGWFDYKAFPPTQNNQKWDNRRIMRGGGWGMRIMYPNGSDVKKPIEPPEENGDYRVDTDVITSFWIYTDSRITPESPTTVTFYVDGSMVEIMDVVLPEGGSQLVWAKWHTPKEPTTVNVTAEIAGGGYFSNEEKRTSKSFKIVDMNENVPPDPRAKDYNTGKPVQRPNGWMVPRVPIRVNNTTATWGDWSAFWKSNWVWHENWEKVGTGIFDEKGKETYEWVDNGEWVDEGDWEYFWNSYSAFLSANYKIKPDDKVPTAKQFYDRWEMKSGYGLNIEVDVATSTDAPSSAVTSAQNVISYFPEFNYNTYWRLSEKTSNRKFELQKNKYSPNERRVHYTPLWFPDDEKYTPYSEVIDLWTPAGMLSVGLDDYIDIKGNVFDDWRVVPAEP